MNCRCWLMFGALAATLAVSFAQAEDLAAKKGDSLNEPLGDPGVTPLGENEKRLNLDFETGTLQDWTATGKAFDQQPIQGEIDQKRVYGEGKKSDHTGQFWIGGFERLFDEPIGTLTSSPFTVTHPYASFLIGGGASKETRVELVLVETGKKDGVVFFTASGQDQENLRPVVVDMQKQLGKKIFIRLVDAHTGGWGHLNFDDFRFHKNRPRFRAPLAGVVGPKTEELYPHAGISAEDAAKAMVLPPGFSVQVAAAEPDVQQPIAMALDDRGRVWIAEAYTYPQRAPEGQGKDRILILEDTDLDGKLDKRTVFQEGLNLVSGLEIGFGGVWVGAAPYLLFIPDKDGDDKADGPPQVLLDGWGYEDTHEVLNSFLWGPDGWLYGCHGVFTHSNVGKPGTPPEKRTPLNAGVWRYHPVRREFEVFAHGTSNPWGLDYDANGAFLVTACVIPHLFHIIPGARYERQAGGHFNPHTYDDIKTIADHRHFTGSQWNDDNRRQSDELGGGHAHAGCMIYQGGAWPEKYRGQLFMNNIHGNRINMEVLSAKGSGLVASHGPDFLLTRDQWSQMLALTYGPDGQVWVIDWYDRQQCHQGDPKVHDRNNGRIYRIVYDGAKPVKVDLGKLKTEELLGLLAHPNEWYRRHAQRILQERVAKGTLDLAAFHAAILKQQPPDSLLGAKLAEWELREAFLVNALFGHRPIILHDLENLQPEKLPAQKREEMVEQRLASMLSPHESHQGSALPSCLLQMFLTDPASQPATLAILKRQPDLLKSPAARLAAASALQRVPLANRWEILELLTKYPEDAADHNLPLMYWYALEPLAELDPQRALALGLSAGQTIPILKEYVIRRIGAGDLQKSLALLLAGLKAASDDAARLTFLRGIKNSLLGRKQIAAPAGWAEIFASLCESPNRELRMELAALGVAFNDQKVLESLRRMIADPNSTWPERRQAIQILAAVSDTAAAESFRGALAQAELRGAALRGLAAVDDPQAPAAILAIYEKLSPAERRDALATLCSRVGYAQALLGAIEKKQLPANHLTADLVANLRGLNDEGLNKIIEQSWGTVRATAADKAKLIAEYRALLSTPAAVPPDVQLGRAVFTRTCQQCHTLFGAGGKVGPDITGAQRGNLDYLLSNVLDPSAVLAKEYQPTVVMLADGRVVTGVIKEETAAALSLQTPTELVVVPKSDIAQRKVSDKSMMPDDLFRPLNRQEVRSLVAYLASPGQTPLLGNQDNVTGFFNGKDLTGWVGDRELWKVEGGEIIGKTAGLPHNAFLVSELSLADFRLELEVKLLHDAGNSGVQFRSQPLADGEMKGYQADVGPGWWGKLYEENGRGLLWDKEAVVNKGDWNKYEILAVGSRVQTWLNGQPCVDWEDDLAARRGVIAVQLHSGEATEVRFRNLKLSLIPPLTTTSYFKASAPLAEGKKLAFKKTTLDDKFRSEGVGYGDFNNDGRLDIAAGSVWYEAPAKGGQWQMHTLLEKAKEFNIKTYGDTFMNWAEDVDGDGRQDLIVVDFPGAPTWWFQNPGVKGGVWPRNRVVPATNDESPLYVDLNGDGRRELLYGDAAGRMCFAQPLGNPGLEWQATPIGGAGDPNIQKFYHGLGVGDLNRDGRDDVVVPGGWWEAPSTPAADPWAFHPAPFGEAQAQMYVFDFDGDGDSDVVGSSAHRRGIWWYEQLPENKWKTHEIDLSIAQTHALCLADMNGDGLPDLITGKRYYAHNGNDPGEDEPALLAWYELKRDNETAAWTQHIIDRDSGVGTQFEVHDMNNDGLLDILVANKRGVFYLEQTRE